MHTLENRIYFIQISTHLNLCTFNMSHSKESTFPTEEVTLGDVQKDSDAEQTTLSQQGDADEQVEDTAQETQSQVSANDTQLLPGIR